MDPIAALKAWLAGADNDARRNLNNWLAKGGFRPRVELSPSTDAWMAGDRFGEVVKVGSTYVHVRMDRSGRTRMVPPNLVDVLAGSR